MASHYVLPVRHLTTMLYGDVSRFCAKQKMEEPEIDTLLGITRSLFDYSLCKKMRWSRPDEDVIGNEVKKVFGWYDLDCPEGSLSDVFYLEALEPCLTEVNNLIKAIVDKDEWCIWHTTRIGDDIILERGDDFRIVDWELRFGDSYSPEEA